MNKLQLLSAFLIAATVFYIFFYIATKNYLISHLIYAVLCSSIHNLSFGVMNFLMFKKTDKKLIGLANWMSLFSYSQLISNFIPGLGVLYRATILKKTKGVAIKDSTTALFRAAIITFIFMIIFCLVMYWHHFLNYNEVIFSYLIFGLFGLFIIYLFSIFILKTPFRLLHIFPTIENKLIIDLTHFKSGTVLMAMCMLALSLITMSIAFFFIVSAQNDNISAFDCINIFIIMKALSFAPSFIPANLGVQEVALIGINQLANIGIDDILIFSLIIRVMNLASNLLILIVLSQKDRSF